MKKQTCNRQFVGLVILTGVLFLLSLLFQPQNQADAKPPGGGNEASDKAVNEQSLISSSFLIGNPCFNRMRPVDVVFVVDTSGSMLDDQGTVNSFRIAMTNAIIEEGVVLMKENLGITETVSGFGLQDNVLNRFGDTVPGGNELLTCGPLDHIESWAAGTAIVAERYPWRKNSLRIIIPVSDEGPCRGEPCDFFDEKSIENAINIALLHDVTVFPLMITNADQCVLQEGFRLAFFTSGEMFLSHQPPEDMAQAIVQLVRDSTRAPMENNIIRGGVADDFLENVAIEQASPGSGLATILAACPLGAADFDQTTLGACFGHTLIGIPQPEVIIAATAQARAMLCAASDINFLSGPGKGVILIKLPRGTDRVLGFVASTGDRDLLTVETNRGASQTISTAKHGVTGRGGRGRKLLQRGQFIRVIRPPVIVPTLADRD